jgi:hypothetical protein
MTSSLWRFSCYEQLIMRRILTEYRLFRSWYLACGIYLVKRAKVTPPLVKYY